uniref:Calcium channel, voltage-dependent, gamma subunit 7b n=1 Tax=Lepisosteus oculatus TaxID=7918 RepID=W5LVT9_LEPOC
MSSCSSRALTLLSSVFGASGLLLVGVAVSTDYWLLMEEGIVLQQNQTTEVKMALHAGLWRVCFIADTDTHRYRYRYTPTPILTPTPIPLQQRYRYRYTPTPTTIPTLTQILIVLILLPLLILIPSAPLSQGAGVMSVYLFMKRYAEEEMYRPHPALYRPRLSECSDYSGQFLHPTESWTRPGRGRSSSEVSSDISIQLNQTPPPPLQALPPAHPKASGGILGGASASYPLPPPSSASSSSHAHSHPHPHPHSSHPHSHPSQALPLSMPPPAAGPPPRYHAHLRMSASPC